MSEIWLVLIIAIIAGFLTYRHSRTTRIIGAIVVNHVSLFLYFIVGIFINNEYEPEMMIGWFIFSILANIAVVPVSYIIGALLLKFRIGINDVS